MTTSAQASPGAARRERASSQRRGSAVARQLVLGAIPGLAAGLSLGVGQVAPWPAAALVGWGVAGMIYLVQVWTAVWGLDAERTAAVARREDPRRALANVLLVATSVSCIVGVAYTLRLANRSSGADSAGLWALAAFSLVTSWLVVHTVFTLTYARIYYSGEPGGIAFNEKPAPVYLDFAYVAFTIGMTFQVSDTDLESKAMRHTALRHALVSYLFGAVILAMTVNVGASLLK